MSPLARAVLRVIIATGMTVLSSACWAAGIVLLFFGGFGGRLAGILVPYLGALGTFVGSVLGFVLDQKMALALTTPFLVGLAARSVFGIPRDISVAAIATGLAVGWGVGALSLTMGLHEILLLPFGTAWIGSLVGAFVGWSAANPR